MHPLSIALIILLILIALRFARWRYTSRVERPATKIVARYGDIEIRIFKSQIRATVTVQWSEVDAPSQAFGILAWYIFWKNTTRTKVAMTAPVITQKKNASEKISMTAPVISQSVGEWSYEVSFMMPESYTMETLPVPKDSRITIHNIPEKTRAVVMFNGFATAERIKKYRTILIDQLEKSNIAYRGETIVAQYNDPWTPRLMRTNEIQVVVSYTKSKK